MNWRDLHERAKRGDRVASRQLYEAAADAVFRQCALATRGDHHAAKDLSQEVWVRVFRQLHQLAQPEAFVSWALAIASTVATSRFRLDHRRAALLERFATEAALDAASDSEAERLRREALVRECLQGLEDPRHRDLASAVYVEGLTTRDAAARLGLPHGTVTVTLMRLRTRLRATLARQLAAEEGA